MGLAALKTKIDVNIYLEGEETGAIRHEYLYGEVYAMAGTTQSHNRIVRNLLVELSRHLSASPCEPYAENIKVRTSPEVFYYPDVIVTCEGEFKNPYFCEAPVFIIEVTSSSTLRIDKTEKLVAYQLMPSIQEIVLVDQHQTGIEIYRRQLDDQWVTHYFSKKDEELELESLAIKIRVADVYASVLFAAERSGDEFA